MQYVTRSLIEEFLDQVGGATDAAGELLLIGETSLVWEGRRSWTDEIEVALLAEADDAEELENALRAVSRARGVTVVDEFPGDVIPLPAGWRQRCRPIEHEAGSIGLAHFDPYSVSFRFLARGDEEDYALVIGYLECGWIDGDEMDRQLAELLPRFSFETIAQDPAEFRRKYKGLQQMARARGLI